MHLCTLLCISMCMTKKQHKNIKKSKTFRNGNYYYYIFCNGYYYISLLLLVLSLLMRLLLLLLLVTIMTTTTRSTIITTATIRNDFPVACVRSRLLKAQGKSSIATLLELCPCRTWVEPCRTWVQLMLAA